MTILGVDLLGGAFYQEAALKTHPQGWAACTMPETFHKVKGWEFVKRLAASRKVSELIVYLTPFDNSHKYPIKQLMPLIEANSKKLEIIQKNNPGTKIYASPFTEHNHTAKNMLPVFAKIKQLAPSCALHNSIWKGEEVDGVPTEIHLVSSKSLPKEPKGEYMVSFDGFGGDGSGDFPDTDVQSIKSRYPRALQFRLWNFRYNGKFGNKDTTPVAKRKNWPSEQYLRGHNAILKDREGGLTYPANALYKTFADDHGAGAASKDNHALVICQKEGQSIDVKDKNGKKIATMTRVLPDFSEGKPKGKRYYYSGYAFQLGNLAQKSSGSRLIQIGDLPLTDADLRSGYFR